MLPESRAKVTRARCVEGSCRTVYFYCPDEKQRPDRGESVGDATQLGPRGAHYQPGEEREMKPAPTPQAGRGAEEEGEMDLMEASATPAGPHMGLHPHSPHARRQVSDPKARAATQGERENPKQSTPAEQRTNSHVLEVKTLRGLFALRR